MNKQELDNAVSDRNALKKALEILSNSAVSPLQQNYKGVWVSGDEIKKFDIVYVDGESTRIFYMAKNDIDESTTLPALDTENWQEFLETSKGGTAKKYYHHKIRIGDLVHDPVFIDLITSNNATFTTQTLLSYIKQYGQHEKINGNGIVSWSPNYFGVVNEITAGSNSFITTGFKIIVNENNELKTNGTFQYVLSESYLLYDTVVEI